MLGKQSGEVLTLSALFAIWVASNAVEAFRIAFDRAYAVPDPRGFIENRALAILLVFLGAIVAALLGVSILFSPLILRFAQQVLLMPVPAVASYSTYLIGVLVFIGFVLVMHRTLPGRRMKSMRLWPGVLVTTVLWVLASGFSIYLSFTPSYTVIYGTLAGVIITLMFFYLTGATIIYGAEVNAALNRIGASAARGDGMAVGLKKRRRIRLGSWGRPCWRSPRGWLDTRCATASSSSAARARSRRTRPARASGSGSGGWWRRARSRGRAGRSGSRSPMAGRARR